MMNGGEDPARVPFIIHHFPSFPQHVVEHFLVDVDRQGRLASDGHGDCVAGPGVDLRQFPLEPHAELGEVGVLAELADYHVLKLRRRAAR